MTSEETYYRQLVIKISTYFAWVLLLFLLFLPLLCMFAGFAVFFGKNLVVLLKVTETA